MSDLRTGNKDLARELNRSRIFTCITTQGPLSRREVARALNIAPSVVTTVVNEFIGANLVHEMESDRQGNIGRPPIHVNINEQAGYVVGIHVRQNRLTAAICDLRCQVIYAYTIALSPGHSARQEETVAAMIGCIKECLQEAHIDQKQILGVGVGLSGVVDTLHGTSQYSPLFDWNDVALGPALEFKLHLPVRLDNDVRTLILAEHHFGQAKKVSNALFITIGTRVGLGIILNGELFRGLHGGAGEFGHNTVDRAVDAPLCQCGKRGCLEAFVSDYALVAGAHQHNPQRFTQTTIHDLITMALDGNSIVQTIFTEAGNALGQGIATLVNLFDTDLIFLTGQILKAGKLLLEPMRNSMSHNLFDRQHRHLSLLECSIDDVDWARGAACLILDELLRPPLYRTEEPLIIDALLSLYRPLAHTRR